MHRSRPARRTSLTSPPRMGCMQKHEGLVRLATKMAQLMARLTDRPSPTACWYWRGKIHRRGYVRLRGLGRELSLPVAAYLLAHGRLPEGRLVRRCRGGIRCGNPSHYVERAKKKLARSPSGVGLRHRGGLAGSAGFSSARRGATR